jgi:hypothetical protein
VGASVRRCERRCMCAHGRNFPAKFYNENFLISIGTAYYVFPKPQQQSYNLAMFGSAPSDATPQHGNSFSYFGYSPGDGFIPYSNRGATIDIYQAMGFPRKVHPRILTKALK